MKKVIFATCIAVALAGCGPSASDETKKFPIMPDGLKDCKIFNIVSEHGSHLTVVRCPASSTTAKYQQGKMQMTVATISGDDV